MIVSHPILLREEGEYGRKGRPQFTVDELAYRHGDLQSERGIFRSREHVMFASS